MSARAFAWVSTVALVACGTDHRIEVETDVSADGAARRTLVFAIPNAEEPETTWSAFAKPDEPYRVEAASERFRASGEFARGSHPSGLRPVVRPEGEQAEPEILEGTFAVDVRDLAIGRVYRYRETIEIGVDLEEARRALDRWLRLGLDLALEALRLRFPDADLSALESHARESLLPRFEAVAEASYLQFLEWWRTGVDLGLLRREDRDHAVRFWRLAESAWARLGVVYSPPLESKDFLEGFLEEGNYDFGEFVEREIAPRLGGIPEAQREEFLSLFTGEGLAGLAKSVEALFEERYPTEEEERKRLEIEGTRAAVAVFGFPITRIFDTLRVRFALRMPGRILRTNGEIGPAPGEVCWSLSNEHFWLVAPELHALAFDVESWAKVDAGGKERVWTVESLRRIEEGLKGVSDTGRATIRKILSGDPGLEGDLGAEDRGALERIRKALGGEGSDE
jgi:hypothetical protein